jgi:hypothetical protein
MLFNLLIFVLFAAVAYFHYAEGLFSATISAVLCILAAAVALGYHELITPYIYTKLPEQADGIALVVLFAAAYIIPRLVFDKFVPGNVRFPILMDRIGAGVMGLVAGIFSTGVLAIAAQSLPFGPSFGGYSRQDLQDRPSVTLPPDATANGRSFDSFVNDQLVGDSLGDSNHLGHLWVHQDEAVLGMVNTLSSTGSALSNGAPLADAHPDYLTELFGQRLGVEVGGRHTAVSTAKAQTLGLNGVFMLSKAPPPADRLDAEFSSVRGDQTLPDVPSPSSSTVLADVRVTFSPSTDVTDADGLLRLSPAAVRLKAGGHDYYPVGTLVGNTVLVQDRADDPLMIDLRGPAQTVDFLFVIDHADEDLKIDSGKDKSVRFRDNSYLEVKRYAQADLSGTELSGEVPEAKVEADFAKDGTLGGVMRKRSVGTVMLSKLGGVEQMPAGGKAKPDVTPAPPKRGGSGILNKSNNSDVPSVDDAPGRQFGL